MVGACDAGGSVNAAIDEHFDKLGFKNPIAPGTRVRESSSPTRSAA
jgi:hypothetical protein